MARHFLPREALPGPLPGHALGFGPWPLTHGFPWQHTGPTAVYPGDSARPWLLRASCAPAASGWRLLRRGPGSTEGCWRFRRSPGPWLTSVGRCSPPGWSAVQTGQYRGMPAPSPVPLGSSASASGAGALARWLHPPFASAARRGLRDGIPGVRLPGAAVSPRFRPLSASRRPGGDAVTPAPGGREAHPHGKLRYQVHHDLAVYPEAAASLRPTGRTSMKAVLLVQPYRARTCSMAS